MMQPVYTLLCQRDLPMALVTVPRILNALHPGQPFIIFDDGSFTDDAIAQLSELSPVIKIVTKAQRDASINELLKNHPNCLKYRDEFPLAFKLLDVPLTIRQEGGSRFTFTDSDIIYYKGSEGYFNRGVNTYLKTDAIKLSVKLQKALLEYKWKIPLRFNSGYFSYDVNDFDLDFVDHYLGLPDVRNMPWLSEQTCWALLFALAGKSVCPKENEFVCQEKFDGPKSDTLAVHLIGGLKPKYKEWSAGSFDGPGVKPGFEPSRNVNMVDWAIKVARRYMPGK